MNAFTKLAAATLITISTAAGDKVNFAAEKVNGAITVVQLEAAK